MINAIAPARIMMMLIMLWREKETGNYFIPLCCFATWAHTCPCKRYHIKTLNFFFKICAFLEIGALESGSPQFHPRPPGCWDD